MLMGNSVDEEARVKIFIQGKNRWRDEKDWPIARANETSFFFEADGGLQKVNPVTATPSGRIFLIRTCPVEQPAGRY